MTFTVRLTAIAVGSLLLVGTPLAGASAGPRELGAASPTGTQLPNGGPDVGPRRSCPTATTTTLAVTPSSGPAYRAVTITVAVAGAADAYRTTRGAVTVRDGDVVLARRVALVAGRATVTTNALGPGPHQITAEFTGTDRAAGSVSGPFVATFDGGAAGAGGTAAVTIPAGALTITSAAPRAVSGRLRLTDVVITDTRAGNLGFTASVVAGPIVDGSGAEYPSSYAGLVHLDADQVPGNALRARDVRVQDIRPGSPGLDVPRTFAHYPSGLSTGTVRVQGVLEFAGIPARARVDHLRTALTFTVM